MNKKTVSAVEQFQPPNSISAEEFDAKFDAGEDMSAYIDWENAVMVQPGQLSPGQKRAMARQAEAEKSANEEISPTEK